MLVGPLTIASDKEDFDDNDDDDTINNGDDESIRPVSSLSPSFPSCSHSFWFPPSPPPLLPHHQQQQHHHYRPDELNPSTLVLDPSSCFC
ncbi:unnamed protein product [Protopolystoma xenopodis]|uniref:Uncharacterized protein n=1 Tax=Protopolystoma xenopodis TaxID=117903 RepID=A0A3S5BBR2_9PLAT|nr:unnamed protein product [Protopolystoma xenopodis]